MDPRIKHLVVLMLENRSFDHMLGFAGLPNVEGIPTDPSTLPPNLDYTHEPVHPNRLSEYAGDLDPDPGHDFVDVRMQLFNTDQPASDARPNMQGFVSSYLTTCQMSTPPPADSRLQSRNIMKCYVPDRVDVLATLAANYAVCDHWFSSVPGPTLPNRLFAHAGYSHARLDMSAGDFAVRPTLYEVLDGSNVSSTIYADGWSATTTFWDLMKYQDRFYGTLDNFYQDCAENNLPAYCFLEPRYASGFQDGVYRPQNDQHPDSDIRTGEELIFNVYQALRSNRRVWNSTMLAIVYDEHGGLFDHVPPPVAVAPQEGVKDATFGFDFKLYGVRVPAVIVSAYTKPGTVLHQVFDHTSLCATACKLLADRPPDAGLGARANSANTFEAALNLETPRTAHVPFRHFRTLRNPDTKRRRLNHLQLKYRDYAQHVESQLPAGKRSSINAARIDNDQDLQHYLERVYAAVKGSA